MIMSGDAAQRRIEADLSRLRARLHGMGEAEIREIVAVCSTGYLKKRPMIKRD
jgi:hypothetical protein